MMSCFELFSFGCIGVAYLKRGAMNRDSGHKEEVLAQKMCRHPAYPPRPRQVRTEISLKTLDFRGAGTGQGWSHLCGLFANPIAC